MDVFRDVNVKAGIKLGTVTAAAVTWCWSPLAFKKPFSTHSTVLSQLLVVKFHLHCVLNVINYSVF